MIDSKVPASSPSEPSASATVARVTLPPSSSSWVGASSHDAIRSLVVNVVISRGYVTGAHIGQPGSGQWATCSRPAQLDGARCRTGSMAEPGEIVDRLLAAYPHAAACPACRSYAAMIIKDHTSALGVAAVLGRHAADHRVDPLSL